MEIICFHVLIQDILVGLLRLRKCGKNVTCPELTGKCSIVRELHVYGTAVPVHGRDADKLQHQGYGTLLMEEAEMIAIREHRSTKIAVISGVGTRHYYRKLGYELEGPYMVKYLKWQEQSCNSNATEEQEEVSGFMVWLVTMMQSLLYIIVFSILVCAINFLFLFFILDYVPFVCVWYTHLRES